MTSEEGEGEGGIPKLTYVPDIVLKGCVFRARDCVRPRARNHATFQNDIRDIS